MSQGISGLVVLQKSRRLTDHLTGETKWNWGTFLNYGNNFAEREKQKNLEEKKTQQCHLGQEKERLPSKEK